MDGLKLTDGEADGDTEGLKETLGLVDGEKDGLFDWLGLAEAEGLVDELGEVEGDADVVEYVFPLILSQSSVVVLYF